MAETPEERKLRLAKQLEKAREANRLKREQKKALQAAGQALPAVKARRPRNLDKIVREILEDDELVDLVVQNQPEWWSKLQLAGKPKTVSYIMSTVMAVKAMGGDIKAAEWIRKTGFGDKVMLEDTGGFFNRSEFTISVVPSKQLEETIESKEVLQGEIKQIEETDESTTVTKN